MTEPQRMHDALAWLAGRDTGMSSTAILYAALGMPGGSSHPYDPDDLLRCLRLIDLHPWSAEGLPVLAERCPAWRALAAHWDELRALVMAEVGSVCPPFGSRLPRTYARMRELLMEAARD